ncbi:MAG: VTT domain-containing protein [Chloroflexi bacterium]|nr:VTT domain-containing protein [Chloroflexota bacterium]
MTPQPKGSLVQRVLRLREKIRWRVPTLYLRLLALTAVVAVSALAVVYQSNLEHLKGAGYPAIFLISLLGNASVILPVPAILAVCSGGALLNPPLVGVVGGLGQALGEVTGYMAGFSGRGLAQRNALYARIRPWVERRGWIVVLLFALVPNPFFDVVGLIAGALHMPFWRFFAVTLLGKTLRSIGVAMACSLGYDLFFLEK